MLTLFAIPKSFVANAHTALIQRNAIGSWVRLLDGRGEVLLCGDDPGVAETARELGARHLPGIATTELGTPILSDAFERVRNEARHEVIAYANSDIVFFPELLPLLERIRFSRYLAIGERWNLDVTSHVDFHDPEWSRKLQETARRDGARNHLWGMDYFIFPRRVDWAMPRFVVGRPYWDHWMIQRALDLRIPVVDLSMAVLAVHQNHGYEHVPQSAGRLWHGPEGDHNRRLYGGVNRGLGDATHEMEADGRIGLALSDRTLRFRARVVHERAGGRVAKFVARGAGWVLRHGLKRSPKARWWRLIVHYATR